MKVKVRNLKVKDRESSNAQGKVGVYRRDGSFKDRERRVYKNVMKMQVRIKPVYGNSKPLKI